MNRLDARFAALAASGRTGLIPFVTAGDPDPAQAVALMHALVEGGADVIELGVPYSDPMADGPVIQRSSERALARGVGLRKVLAWVGEFRRTDEATPVVLMGYLNPLELYGLDRFARDAADAGVDGVLLVDCPVEEAEPFSRAFESAGMHQIHLAAPTTAGERLERVCAAARGFLYYVAFAGVTGADRLVQGEVQAHVAAIRRASRVPVAVGFGIKDAASAASIGAFADAVVIGSALVEHLHAAGTGTAVPTAAMAFLAPIRAALDARVGG
jgi:tryptophan synthase alpha chain